MESLRSIPGCTCLSNCVNEVTQYKLFKPICVTVLAVIITAWLFSPPAWVLVAVGISAFVITLLVQWALDQPKAPVAASAGEVPFNPQAREVKEAPNPREREVSLNPGTREVPCNRREGMRPQIPPIDFDFQAAPHLKQFNLANPQEDPFPAGGTSLPTRFYIGSYGDPYLMTKPYVIVKLPSSCLPSFPEAVRRQFEGLTDDQIELSFAIHQDIESAETTVRYLVTHPLVCPPNTQPQGTTHFLMGIFDMFGVDVNLNKVEALIPGFRSTDQVLRQKLLPSNAFESREVTVHENGTAFSPFNCQFQCQKNVSTFVTAVDMRQPQGYQNNPNIPYQARGAACFHIFVRPHDNGRRTRDLTRRLPHFVNFLHNLPEEVRNQLLIALSQVPGMNVRI